MRRLSLSIVFCLIGFPAWASDKAADLRAELDAIANETRLSSYVIGISRKGAPPQFIAWHAEGATVVDADSIYSAGSISKTVAAWTVISLATANDVDLDKPLGMPIAGWTLPANGFDPMAVTLRSLLSHMAGVSLPGYRGWDRVEDVPSITASLNGRTNGEGAVELVAPPGKAYAYSGGGFSILQLWAENTGAKPYTDLVNKLVLSPLGMTATRFIPPTVASPQPVDRSGASVPRVAFAEAAAAGLYTSPRDLMRFALAHIPDRAAPLSAAQRALIQKSNVPRLPRDELNIQLMWAMDPDPAHRVGSAGYGLGTQRFVIGNDRVVVGHGGSISGARAMFWVLPETGDTIVGMATGDNGNAVLGRALCRWREAIGTANHAESCKQLAQPELFDAFAQGRVAGVGDRLRVLDKRGGYDLNEQVILDVLANASAGNLGAPLTVAERDTLLELAAKRHPKSVAVLLARARAAAPGPRQRFVDAARRLDPNEPELAEFAR